MTQSIAQPQQKDFTVLHAELGCPSETNIWAIGTAMSLHLSGIFKPCQDSVLGKAKKSGVSKKNIKQSKIS